MLIYLAGGESRHWLNTPLIEENENATVFGGRILQKYGKRSQADCMGGIVPEVDNESLSCKPAHDTKIQERAQFRNSPIRGGIPDEVKNENISGRASIIADQKYRGGL